MNLCLWCCDCRLWGRWWLNDFKTKHKTLNKQKKHHKSYKKTIFTIIFALDKIKWKETKKSYLPRSSKQKLNLDLNFFFSRNKFHKLHFLSFFVSYNFAENFMLLFFLLVNIIIIIFFFEIIKFHRALGIMLAIYLLCASNGKLFYYFIIIFHFIFIILIILTLIKQSMRTLCL